MDLKIYSLAYRFLSFVISITASAYSYTGSSVPVI